MMRTSEPPHWHRRSAASFAEQAPAPFTILSSAGKSALVEIGLLLWRGRPSENAIAVRKNMERLRALRQAREAEEARTSALVPPNAKKLTAKKKRKRIFSN